MTCVYMLRSIADLQLGDHVCCLYETEEERKAVQTLFLRQGLERGEKLLYIMDEHSAETVLQYLRDDGVVVEPYLASGQLCLVTSNDTYLRNGTFDPDEMVAMLRSETERALAEGYPVLRVTGEMTWTLSRLQNLDRLIEYESRLNAFLPGSRCLAICQYDRRRFPYDILPDVLATHPIIAVGTVVYDFH